jgi:predicted phosphohydrolase
MYWINTWDNNGVSISGEYSIENAERNFNMSIKRCGGTDNKVVLTHHGYIFTDNSRHQAELALSYLKNNYPTYTNFRICGTGEWDDPYGASMEKTLKVYDVRNKKISYMAADEDEE